MQINASTYSKCSMEGLSVVQFSCQKITGRRRAYVVDVEEVKSEPAEVVGAVVNAHEKVSTYAYVHIPFPAASVYA